MPTTEDSSFTPEQQAELARWFPAELLDARTRWLAREEARELLQSAMAAALADPNVSRVAKSLAGYVLKWLEREETE